MTAPGTVNDPASGSDADHRVICCRARTEHELEDALVTAGYREALVLIEFVMSRLDPSGALPGMDKNERD